MFLLAALLCSGRVMQHYKVLAEIMKRELRASEHEWAAHGHTGAIRCVQWHHAHNDAMLYSLGITNTSFLLHNTNKFELI